MLSIKPFQTIPWTKDLKQEEILVHGLQIIISKAARSIMSGPKISMTRGNPMFVANCIVSYPKELKFSVKGPVGLSLNAALI